MGNIGLKKKDGTIEAYDLGSEVLNKCNIHTGVMNSFHQTRKGTKNYQKDMKELQYDMLYGKQYVWKQRIHLRNGSSVRNPAAYGDEGI